MFIFATLNIIKIKTTNIMDTVEVLESEKENCLLTDTFEDDWKRAISGEEFVRRAHEHIKKLYAQRDKQQIGC